MKVLTQYASHANTIADTFRAAFTKSKVGPFSVVMTAPTESTGGGLLALQHITLVPASGMALVIGTVNAKDKRVELRSYAHVARMHLERFKNEVPFDEAAYGELLEKAEGVLGAFGLDTSVTDRPRDTAPSFSDPNETSLPPDVGDPDAPRPARTALWLAVLAATILFAGGALWYALQP